MDKYDLEAARYIMENSDGYEKRIGDFIIRHDFGANVYYDGPGGDVTIPEEVGAANLWNTFKNVTNITSLCIPGTVRCVSEMTFGSKTMLQRLVLQEGVEEIIDDNFMAGCKELREVSIPTSLRYLEAHAFRNTPWFRKNVEKVDGCHYLGRFLVDSDKKIERAVVREGTTMICGKAFKDRAQLKEVIIPEGVQTIGGWAFQNCDALTSIHLPASVNLVMYGSFTGWRLRNIEIENTEATISEEAFGIYPGFYPDYAFIPMRISGTPDQKKFFAYCYLTSRERFSPELQAVNDVEVKKRKSWLLDTIIQNGNVNALRNIAPMALTKVNVEKAIESSTSVDIRAFLLEWRSSHLGAVNQKTKLKKELEKDPFNSTDMKKIWSFSQLEDGTLEITSYKGNDTTVEVPPRIGKTPVTSIGECAFSPCKDKWFYQNKPRERMQALRSLQTVILPEGITTIRTGAFGFCSGLETIDLPSGLCTIMDSAFIRCSGLKSIVLPDSLRTIMDSAFSECSSLREVRIPDQVKVLSDNLFRNCRSISKVVLPKNLTWIGYGAFENCRNLTELHFFNHLRSIQKGAFSGCTQLTIYSPAGSYMEWYAKKNNIPVAAEQADDENCGAINLFRILENDFIVVDGVLREYVGQGGDVAIPNGVTVISAHVFQSNNNLTSVSLPDSAVTIEESAFSGCKRLTSVSLPDSLNAIESHAFYDCESLISMEIPEGIKRIGACAFKGCKKLADNSGFVIVSRTMFDYFGDGGDIVVPEGVEGLSDYAFERCNAHKMGYVKMKSIVLPESLKRIGENVFSHCDSLVDIVIPDHVTELGANAFERCDRLSKVSLPKELVSMGKGAFRGCMIEQISLPESMKTIGAGALSGNHLRELSLPDHIEVIEKDGLYIGYTNSPTVVIVSRGTVTENTVKQYAKENKCEIKYRNNT